MANSTDTISEQRATPKRKNLGRVPKKEHESRREKLKRCHLNELFLELGRALVREKDELRDENSPLQTDIERLKRRTQPDPLWPNGMDMAPSTLDRPTTAAMQTEEQAAGPLYLISNHQELHSFSETGNTPPLPNPSSNVSRPRARSPTSSDSWPLDLLSKHQREAHETQCSLSSRTTSNCTEGSDTSRE